MPNPISRWWWYIVLLLICHLLLAIPFPSDDLIDWYTIVSLFVVYLTGFPLLGICLFIDAQKVRASEINWHPNPYLYGILGLAHYSPFMERWVPEAIIESSAPEAIIYVPVIIVSTFYLFQRFRHVGFPLKDRLERLQQG